MEDHDGRVDFGVVPVAVNRPQPAGVHLTGQQLVEERGFEGLREGPSHVKGPRLKGIDEVTLERREHAEERPKDHDALVLPGESRGSNVAAAAAAAR